MYVLLAQSVHLLSYGLRGHFKISCCSSDDNRKNRNAALHKILTVFVDDDTGDTSQSQRTQCMISR